MHGEGTVNGRTGAASERTVMLDVSILGREFKVACKEAERAELNEAVALLDRRMREIRDSGKVSGTDRIAVMAALNLAHDLLRERRTAKTGSVNADAAVGGTPIDVDATRRRIQSMQSAIDQAMAGQDNLF
jgi:cell division protein ZapA